ncbi:MAG TPA: F0F1 ATP synthase subunit epsilon [Desulfohalobiaceae bacterium]|nr:F0F1 ATP synthase subunit epsilon [Desulfohalobiaceae bacterium]
MAETIRLEIVTPDQKVLSDDVEYVGIPGLMGQLGVLKNHIPFLTALAIGSLYFRTGGKNSFVFVSGGFAEISPESVTILAESAERAEEIDISRAKKSRERAEQRLQQEKERMDSARAESALKRAIQRINTKEKQSGSA